MMKKTIKKGIYEELSVAKKISDLLTVEKQIVKGKMNNWIERYFTEFIKGF